MTTLRQSDYERVLEDLNERFNPQCNSRCPSDDEVTMAMLIAVIDKHRAIIDEVHNLAVCASITTPEDMMQNIQRILEITDPKYYKGEVQTKQKQGN